MSRPLWNGNSDIKPVYIGKTNIVDCVCTEMERGPFGMYIYIYLYIIVYIYRFFSNFLSPISHWWREKKQSRPVLGFPGNQCVNGSSKKGTRHGTFLYASPLRQKSEKCAFCWSLVCAILTKTGLRGLKSCCSPSKLRRQCWVQHEKSQSPACAICAQAPADRSCIDTRKMCPPLESHQLLQCTTHCQSRPSMKSWVVWLSSPKFCWWNAILAFIYEIPVVLCNSFYSCGQNGFLKPFFFGEQNNPGARYSATQKTQSLRNICCNWSNPYWNILLVGEPSIPKLWSIQWDQSLGGVIVKLVHLVPITWSTVRFMADRTIFYVALKNNSQLGQLVPNLWYPG